MRKLTAVLFSDIVGFSKQMSEDESKTLEILTLNTNLHHNVVKRFNGTVVKAMGDGYLCTFNSSLDAVQAGLQLIRAVKERDMFSLRIGIHVADVVHNKGKMAKGKDVYGDGVNIAARIESNAPHPGVWVSDRVANDLANHPFLKLESAGIFNLKNIPNPMELFEVVVENAQTLGIDDGTDLFDNYIPKSTRVIKGIGFASAPLFLLFGLWISWLNWQDHNAPESVAVLPFDYIGPNSSYFYLATEFTTGLTSRLMQDKTIKILSHSTAKKFKTNSMLLSELDVDYVIEGNVTFQNDEIEIFVSLITSDNDEPLWSNSYKGQLGDLDEFLDSAKSEISAKLQSLDEL